MLVFGSAPRPTHWQQGARASAIGVGRVTRKPGRIDRGEHGAGGAISAGSRGAAHGPPVTRVFKIGFLSRAFSD